MRPTFLLFLFPFLALAAKKNIPPSRPAKIICLYRMISRPDSTTAATREELTQLAVSDSISEFRSFIRYKSDSLFSTYQGVEMSPSAYNTALSQVIKLPKYQFDGIIIKNMDEKKYSYYGLINRVLYKYEESNQSLKWQILPDTMRVQGYTCQKAIIKYGGRNYNAWFTRQVPISSGPYVFGGLPGLIVSINDVTNSYKFELVHISQSSKNYSILLPDEVIIPKNAAIKISKSQYYESYFAAKRNFITTSTASGMVRFDNEEQLRRNYQEKLKHRNNPIELKYAD